MCTKNGNRVTVVMKFEIKNLKKCYERQTVRVIVKKLIFSFPLKALFPTATNFHWQPRNKDAPTSPILGLQISACVVVGPEIKASARDVSVGLFLFCCTLMQTKSPHVYLSAGVTGHEWAHLTTVLCHVRIEQEIIVVGRPNGTQCSLIGLDLANQYSVCLEGVDSDNKESLT